MSVSNQLLRNTAPTGFSPVNNYGENGNSFIENLYLSGALTSPEFGFAFGIQSPGKKENEYGTSGGL